MHAEWQPGGVEHPEHGNARARAPADKNSHAPINSPADIIGIVRHTRHALLSVVSLVVISRHYDRNGYKPHARIKVYSLRSCARSLRSFAEGKKERKERQREREREGEREREREKKKNKKVTRRENEARIARAIATTAPPGGRSMGQS